MSSIFVAPLKFTVTDSSGWNANNPVSNLNIDPHGMVARSTGTTASFTVNLGSAKSIDTVALIGSTLPATATISVTAGSYSSGATAAFTGSKADHLTTKSIFQFTAVTTSTVTISITAPTSFDIQRLVIGKRVEVLGIDQNCEQTFEDQSVFDNGPGYRSVEQFNVVTGWKAKASWIPDLKWRNEFFPLLSKVGQHSAILFVPVAEEPERFQHEACFGRFSNLVSGESQSSDNYVLKFEIANLAP